MPPELSGWLQFRPGQVERHTHDYKRNGSLSLSAALEIATGTVTTRTSARHQRVEFLDFLNLLARTYPRRQIHVVLDNVSTHKRPAAACLAVQVGQEPR